MGATGESALSRTEPSPDGEDRYERVPFVVNASADSYTIAGTKIPYEISTDFEVHGEVKLKIINEDVDPPNPFEDENSDDPTVTANVAIFDPEILESDVNWRVSLENPEGFEVADLATGTGCDISASWDGFVDGIEVPNPTEYVFVLRANACGEEEPPVGTARQIRGQIVVPPDGGSCPKEAKPKRVALSGLPPAKLEVFTMSGTTKTKLALGFSEEFPGAEELAEEQGDLTKELQDFSGGPKLLLELTFLEEPSVDVVDLKLSARVNVDSSAEARLQKDESEKTVFKGEITIPTNFFTSSNPTGTRFNFGQLHIVDSGPFEFSETFEQNIVSTFEEPYHDMGEYREIIAIPSEPPTKSDQVISSPENLGSLGFEHITFRPAGVSLEAHVNAKASALGPANVVMWTFHGLPNGTIYPTHNAGRVTMDNNLAFSTFKPRLQISNTSGLSTIFLSACNALFLRDYNNAGTTESLPGALEWYNNTGAGATLLLGYMHFADASNVVPVSQLYSQEFSNLSSIADPNERRAMAWMKANLRKGRETTVQDETLALGACAVDRDWFYYIPAAYHQGAGDKRPYPVVSTAKGIYRIPKSKWNVQAGSDWELNYKLLANPVFKIGQQGGMP